MHLTSRRTWASSRSGPPLRSTAPNCGPVYRRHRPTLTPLYPLVQHHLETFLAQAAEVDPMGVGVPSWVERDFRAYLRCGILAHGFARARCAGCGYDFLVAFSCKGRGVCPSCNARRMVETAAHLVDHVLPPLPVRQWVLSVPKRIRPFLHHNPAIAGAVLRIFLRAIRTTLRHASPGASSVWGAFSVSRAISLPRYRARQGVRACVCAPHREAAPKPPNRYRPDAPARRPPR